MLIPREAVAGSVLIRSGRWWLVAVAGLLLAGCSLTGPGPAIAPARVDVFTAGDEGYQKFRIPGVVVTPAGTLLAYAEARRDGGADWGAIDIVLRRSEDGGDRWSDLQVIGRVKGPLRKNPHAPSHHLEKPGAITYNNPTAIVDRRTGAVHMLYCIEYERAFYLRSDDDGRTFSEPVEITAAFEGFRAAYDWKVIAIGPGHGIHLRSGRLIAPVWLSTADGGNAHRPSVAATIYSDDGGATWRAGDIAVPNTEETVNPSETVAVELEDGSVLLNVRTESPRHRRVVVTSADGATGWSEPHFQEELLEPICFGSIARLSGAGDGRPSRLLFVNPDNLLRGAEPGEPGRPRDRMHLTVQLSEDDGKTWKRKKVLDPGWSGYADIYAGPQGTIYCLYERGYRDDTGFRITHLTLIRFDLEWLTDGRLKFEPKS